MTISRGASREIIHMSTGPASIFQTAPKTKRPAGMNRPAAV
jgi:hypothetical protein